MVVVLIIAILIAIAIPAFLGARRKAQDRAAQSNLRTALTSEKSFYTDQFAFTDVPATLELEEPSLQWVDDVALLTASNQTVYVNTAPGTDLVANHRVYIGTESATGTCFWVMEDTSGGTKYSNSNACTAHPADGTFVLDEL